MTNDLKRCDVLGVVNVLDETPTLSLTLTDEQDSFYDGDTSGVSEVCYLCLQEC